MKNFIKRSFLFLLLLFSFGCFLTIVRVNADEENYVEPTSEVENNPYELSGEDTQDNITEPEKTENSENIIDKIHDATETAKLLDESFKYIFGVSIGAFIVMCFNVLVTLKNNKKKLEELQLFKTGNTNATKVINESKVLVNEAKQIVAENAEQIATLIADVSRIKNGFSSVDTTMQSNINNIADLNKTVKVFSEILVYIVSHDEKMVANGTAEKITNMLNKQ